MEHSQILAAPAQPATPALAGLSPDAVEALALHGLRELIFAPIPNVAMALAHLNRDQLGAAIEIMVQMLDDQDGDADLEDGHDAELEDDGAETVAIPADPEEGFADGHDPDEDHTGDEDDFIDHGNHGVGCPIADPGGAAAGEDDEDDDPSGQSTEDEVSYGNPDFGRRGAGCTISDPDRGVDDDGEAIDEREPDDWDVFPAWGDDQRRALPSPTTMHDRLLMAPTIERIRSERCEKVDKPGLDGRTYAFRYPYPG